MSLNLEKFIDGLRDYIAKALKPISANLDDLHKRIVTLEVTSTTKSLTLADCYRGSWQPNSTFLRGQLCTHKGSLWLAMHDTSSRPGDCNDWRLIVKRGEDAR